MRPDRSDIGLRFVDDDIRRYGARAAHSGWLYGCGGHRHKLATGTRVVQDAGAVAVMALERVPSDIRADGGVARMSQPEVIGRIINTVTIPVMAKARIGHFAEAKILETLKAN